MTHPMRERLIATAKQTAFVNYETGYEVDNWPEVLDAILAELREPDAAMREAGLRAEPDCDVQSPIHYPRHAAFVAMIDAVRDVTYDDGRGLKPLSITGGPFIELDGQEIDLGAVREGE